MQILRLRVKPGEAENVATRVSTIPRELHRKIAIIVKGYAGCSFYLTISRAA
jgi:hypothetical protein